VRHRGGAPGLRPAQGQADHPCLTRLPAADPGRRIGSLFINPGGPGASGVEFVQGAGPFLYSDEVRARFDLVGFDLRGIIGSTPLRCCETLDEALADWEVPFQFPVTREVERIWIRSDGRWPGPAPSAPAGS
jgi:pimeloyl-ACP methyl ester carboxylesterase